MSRAYAAIAAAIRPRARRAAALAAPAVAVAAALAGPCACSLNTGASPLAQARDPYFLYLPYAVCSAPGAGDAGAEYDAGTATVDAGPDGALVCRNVANAAAPRVALAALPSCDVMCEALKDGEAWPAGDVGGLARCTTTRRAARSGGGVEVWAYCEYPVLVATYWRGNGPAPTLVGAPPEGTPTLPGD
ncbi:MAG: hypothetical protein IPF92_07000 [Myxococcales bacterium]|nr:hypothetical protein [Myxococcales bacterium]MBL0192789.1 hypothetical protein [Myxococcales bacterium]HQY64243.1 hypothetical protein [Polyangiaceae bacterium]